MAFDYRDYPYVKCQKCGRVVGGGMCKPAGRWRWDMPCGCHVELIASNLTASELVDAVATEVVTRLGEQFKREMPEIERAIARAVEGARRGGIFT